MIVYDLHFQPDLWKEEMKIKYNENIYLGAPPK